MPPSAKRLLARAQALENIGDVDMAYRVYGTVAARHRDRCAAILAVMSAARCERLRLHHKEANRLMLRATELASGTARHLRAYTLIESAMLLNTYGRGSEALEKLNLAELELGSLTVPEVPVFLAARATGLLTDPSASSQSEAASHYIQIAADMAERIGDQREICRVLALATELMVDLGFFSRAHEYARRAFDLRSLSLEGMHASYIYAWFLLRQGNVRQCIEVAREAMTSKRSLVPIFDAKLTAVGLEAALHLGDEAMIRQLMSRSIVGNLKGLGEPQLLAALANALFGAYQRFGEMPKALDLLEECIYLIDHSDLEVQNFCVTVAKYGSTLAVNRARTLLSGLPATPSTRAYMAFFNLVFGKRSNEQSPEELERLGNEAVERFGILGQPLLVAAVLEARGLYKEATSVYRNHTAGGDIRRLAQAPVSRGRPRRSSIEISQRRREIIEYVRAGLTTKEIASRLSLSSRMIDSELTAIYRRFGVRSRYQLISRLDRGTIAI